MADKVKIPSEKFVYGASDEPGLLEQLSRRWNERTPDYPERKLEGYVPVFVYGSLREGFMNHHILKGMPFLGRAHTTIEKFEMREASGGAFPVVFEREPKIKKKRNPVVGKIYGEVYVVDPKTLCTLDRLENNGRMYQRSLQYVFLQQQRLRMNSTISPSIKCWMYLGVPEFWSRNGGAVESVKPKMSNGVQFYDWSDVYESNWSDREIEEIYPRSYVAQ